MNTHLDIRVCPESCLPIARVPADAVWALVEYLSYARVRATYSFDDGEFTVCFPQMDQVAAQRQVDEWASSRMLEAVE